MRGAAAKNVARLRKQKEKDLKEEHQREEKMLEGRDDGPDADDKELEANLGYGNDLLGASSLDRKKEK